jgi:hypothetical protein
MTYKGEDQWVRLGLREFPKTTHLVLVCIADKKARKGRNENVKRKTNYLMQAQNLLDGLAEEEKDLPKNRKRRYHLVTPPNTRNHHELIRFFRGLVEHISDNGEKIAINTTSGLQVWKLALYHVALERRQDIERFYLIRKDTGEIRNIRLYRHLKEYEVRLIHLVYQYPDIGMTELQKMYFAKFSKGNLTFISRTIRDLIQDGLVKEEKTGRTVHLNLTGDGRSYAPSEDYEECYGHLYKS